jgi:CelD/BcsL family acetyltransferase involved in cellulose biosynthesis
MWPSSPSSLSPAERQGSSALDVGTITTDAEFASLKDDWNRIATNTAGSSLFLSHEWFDAAWAWRRLDAALELMVVRRAGQLIGILPAVRNKRAGRGGRRLQLLTVPDTQMTDVIASNSDLPQVADALASALAHRRDWDVLELNYLLPRGATMQHLRPVLRARGLKLEEREGGRNTFIALDGTWTGYYATRSRRLKKANNLAVNRLKKTGEVRVDWLRSAASNSAQTGLALETAIAISSRSWKRETGNSLDQPGPRAFIDRLTIASRERGWLSLWLMHVAERPVAMEYQLIDNGNIHALRSDFDQSCEDFSPGSYLFRHLLEASFGGGFGRYYMGPGENPYKLRWTDQGESLQRLIVYNRTLRGRAEWLREAVVKPALRTMRERLRKTAVSAPADVVSDDDRET